MFIVFFLFLMIGGVLFNFVLVKKFYIIYLDLLLEKNLIIL